MSISTSNIHLSSFISCYLFTDVYALAYRKLLEMLQRTQGSSTELSSSLLSDQFSNCMNILTFVRVITSGAAWSGAGGQLRPGGCCHEAPALSVTSWGRGHPSTGDWPGQSRAGDRETRREGEDTLEEPRGVPVSSSRDRHHPDLLNSLLKSNN